MVWRKEGNGRFDPPGLFRFLVSFSPFQCNYTQLLIILMATTTTRMAARMIRTIRRHSVIPMLSSFAGSTGVGSGVGVTEGTAPETMKAISDTGTKITVGTTGVTMDMTSDVIDNLSAKGGDIEITVGDADRTKLTEQQLRKVGDAPVLTLSAKVGDESVHQLGGKVIVTLPYTLAEGQNATVSRSTTLTMMPNSIRWSPSTMPSAESWCSRRTTSRTT